MLYIHTSYFLFLLQPIAWIIILMVWAIFTKKSDRRKRLLVFAFIAVLFFSNKFIIGKIYNVYEAGYPPDRHYDIGIVLGGFSTYSKEKGMTFNGSADRFFQGIYLYRSQKIDKIMISGGNSDLFDNRIKEADLAAAYLKKLGIPDSVIIIENQSRNTLENAALSYKKIMEVDPSAKIVVITSAWHIPRARLNFRKHFKGDISFYPSNYIGKASYNLTDYVLPSYSSFFKWQFILKEWAGLLADRYRS